MDESITQDNYDYIFITEDCMGNKVALKPGTFGYKILPKHPEVTPDLIREGVESAHIVAKDPHPDRNRFRYYRYVLTPIQGRDDITNLKVVTEINSSNEYGEIITAYLLRDLKGEITKGDIIYDSGSASKRGI